MGFYTPATIVKDAQRHGVKVKPVCVMNSDWRCTIVDDNTFRLGLCLVNGLRPEHGEQIEHDEKIADSSRSMISNDVFRFQKDELRTLAELGALNCFSDIGAQRCGKWKEPRMMTY